MPTPKLAAAVGQPVFLRLNGVILLSHNETAGAQDGIVHGKGSMKIASTSGSELMGLMQSAIGAKSFVTNKEALKPPAMMARRFTFLHLGMTIGDHALL